MQELQDILNNLKARLESCGGGRIIVTSEDVSIRLGKEHETYELLESQTDTEMYNQMWGQ
jgi:hypothetical protein